jgi:serine protease inhibitor
MITEGRHLATGLALAASLCAVACDGEKESKYHYGAAMFPEPTCGGSAAATESAAAIAGAIGELGFELAHAMDADANANVLMSPASISIALGMTWNGALGPTEQEMRGALAYGDLTADEVRAGYRDLLQHVSCASEDVALEYANAIWYRAGYDTDLVPAFVTQSEESFFAPVAPIPAEDPVGYINGWIEERTHGRIEDLVDVLDPDVAMLLVNAIYFKAKWNIEFDTVEEHGAFHAASGDADVAFIGFLDAAPAFPYVETDALQAARVPYLGREHAMTLILPKEGQTADSVLASLDFEAFAALEASMITEDINLSMPRFRVATGTVELAQPLQALGMTAPFDPAVADFGGMFQTQPVYVSRVMHKAFVEVTEKGTEAAAATVVEVNDTGAAGDEVLMRVDRPFLFVIHDVATNAPLFIGKIVEPERVEAK